MIFSFALLAPAVAGTAAATSGSAASFFKNDRQITRADLTKNKLHPSICLDNLSDPAFGELVWFAPEASLEWLQRCRGKTKRRAPSNC
jgi:hypothetical protein